VGFVCRSLNFRVKNLRWLAHSVVWLGGATLAVAVFGCAPTGAPPQKLEPTRENLLLIAEGYRKAEVALKRAPKARADIAPFMDSEDPDSVFVSPRDHQPYVVLWGTETMKMGSGSPVPPPKVEKDKARQYIPPSPMLAYEKTGAEGKRYVLFALGNIIPLGEDDFKKALEANRIQPK
jgi:hypothetical protein